MAVNGTVYISLSAVVLDLPDQTGRYIAKDFAAGWAYIIADAEGDKRFRGQGTCAGGQRTALRYAFLSAVSCVPESSRLTILVEAPEAHRQMVQLATTDAAVIAATGGRLMQVMTRPRERSAFQARSAAERAASAALLARGQDESPPEVEPPKLVADASGAVDRDWSTDWRAKVAQIRQAEQARPPSAPPTASPVSEAPISAEADGAQTTADWLHEFERSVAKLQTDLRPLIE